MSEGDGGQLGRQQLVLSQRGQLKAFAWLSLRNGLLNLVTLTLYRFWGKTEVRRRLWATTYLNDEPFEYTGRGVELFVGFLLALAVLVGPFLIVVFGAQFLGPGLAVLVILPFYVFLGFLFGFGRFTASRYLATRTAWRGVRFGLAGSPAAYGAAYLGYALLSAVTLGWFWPAAERRLAGRLWDSLRFGDHRFEFHLDEARKSPIYGAYALGWVIMVLSYLAFVGTVVALGMMAGTAGPPALGQILWTYAALGVLVLAFAVAFAPFHAAMLRSIAAGVGLGEARFRLRITWLDVAGLSLGNIILLAVSFGFLMPFVEARTRKFLINRMESRGEFALDLVRQGTTPAPRMGEGLADALGMARV